MMKTSLVFLLLFFKLSINDAANAVALGDQKFTLRGRVTFSKGTPPPIERGAKLYITLQDTSLEDVPATLVVKTVVSRVKKFPIPFTLRYTEKDVTDARKRRNSLMGLPDSMKSNTYSIDASIKSNDGKVLLFTNDVTVRVKPLGKDRTKTIDVPVIAVRRFPSTITQKSTTDAFKSRSFPEVVGKNIDEAIKIIKKKTGFTNVVGIKEGMPFTLDRYNDRVRIVYNDKGVVTQVPFVT